MTLAGTTWTRKIKWAPQTTVDGMTPLPFNKKPNFVVSNGTCKGNNEDLMYGPFNITVVRYAYSSARDVRYKTPVSNGITAIMDRVCEFTFVIDNHICRPDSCEPDRTKFGSSKGIATEELKSQRCTLDKTKYDCCNPANLAVSRMTAAYQDPAKQKDGHDCRAWYTTGLPVVQSFVGLVVASMTSLKQRTCHSDAAVKRCNGGRGDSGG